MNNHVRLLLETTGESSLSKIMQGINLAYTLWFNRKNGKVGHLWQGRFKSAVIERDIYLLECGRYIERNPLRAMLVRDLKGYPWSSYRVYGHGNEDLITDRHEIYESMGRDLTERYKAYQEYVLSNRDKEEQEIRGKLGKGVMGSEGFVETIGKRMVDARRPRRGRHKK
jgi:putative transposase